MSFSTKPETADEYINRVLAENKEFYKEPEKLIDEMIRLLEGVKENRKDDKEMMWNLGTAVSEAWHVVLWCYEKDRSTRLVNTIFSWVSKNTTGI